MKDILSLDTMITPKLITVIYWLLLLSAILFGIQKIFSSGSFFFNLMMGLFSMVFGAVAARVWCELLIVFFKINESLQVIKDK